MTKNFNLKRHLKMHKDNVIYYDFRKHFPSKELISIICSECERELLHNEFELRVRGVNLCTPKCVKNFLYGEDQ